MSLPAPGPIALRAVADALLPDNLTVRETGGENRGRYVEEYLRAAGASPSEPWCAAFVRYRLKQAARELGLHLPSHFPISAYVPDYADWAKAHGVWVPVSAARALGLPARGDLALFYFAAKHRVAHIGLVTAGTASRGFSTVEGNTGPDTAVAVNRDGDGVYEKSRTYGALGAHGGFVRLAF